MSIWIFHHKHWFKGTISDMPAEYCVQRILDKSSFFPSPSMLTMHSITGRRKNIKALKVCSKLSSRKVVFTKTANDQQLAREWSYVQSCDMWHATCLPNRASWCGPSLTLYSMALWKIKLIKVPVNSNDAQNNRQKWIDWILNGLFGMFNGYEMYYITLTSAC